MPRKSKASIEGGDLHTLKRKATNTLKLAQKAVQIIAKGEPLSLKRTVGTYPPQMRALLQRIGSEPITSLTIARTPIQSFVSNLLNVVSFGTYERAVLTVAMIVYFIWLCLSMVDTF